MERGEGITATLGLAAVFEDRYFEFGRVCIV